MQRIPRFPLFLLLFALGCGQGNPKPQIDTDAAVKGDDKTSPGVPVVPVAAGPLGGPFPALDTVVARLAEPTPQEKYDGLLLDALNLLADRKTTEALAALEAA